MRESVVLVQCNSAMSRGCEVCSHAKPHEPAFVFAEYCNSYKAECYLDGYDKPFDVLCEPVTFVRTK